MAQAEQTLLLAQLELELLRTRVQALELEKTRLALQEEVQLLEMALRPQLVTQDPGQVLTVPAGQQLPMVLPLGPTPPEEEEMPDPLQEIAQRIGLSLQPSSSPDSES